MYDKNKAITWFKDWKKQQKRKKPAEQSSHFNEWKINEETRIKQELAEKQQKIIELLNKQNNQNHSITEISKLNFDIFLIKDQIKLLNEELKNFIFFKK